MKLLRCGYCGWEIDLYPFRTFLGNPGRVSFRILKNDLEDRKELNRVRREYPGQDLCPQCFETGTLFTRTTNHYCIIAESGEREKL